MAAKAFVVNDVLPATTQLKISWENHSFPGGDTSYYIETDNNPRKTLVYVFDDFPASIEITIRQYQPDQSPTLGLPNDKYYIIDTSTWSENERTISSVDSYFNDFTYEDIEPKGFNITFEENGGTTQTDLTEQTNLPSPLPTPTKSGYKFVAWYYESNFQTRAVAGATIEEDTTLYAKWHNFGSLFTEIADAIRSKDGTSENIRDLDFGERVKQIQGAKEEETKTITPDFSSGNVDVIPTSGKVMTKVTINKDANLIEDNIKSGVTIFGEAGGLVEGKPIEVSTAIAMDNLLVSGNVGKIYKFTGPTDANYINGELYEVVSD